ncbi:MAG: hypothetical protein Kilf2KO_26450 [Rhodospirillales bacterium]
MIDVGDDGKVTDMAEIGHEALVRKKQSLWQELGGRNGSGKSAIAGKRKICGEGGNTVAPGDV